MMKKTEKVSKSHENSSSAATLLSKFSKSVQNALVSQNLSTVSEAFKALENEMLSLDINSHMKIVIAVKDTYLAVLPLAAVSKHAKSTDIAKSLWKKLTSNWHSLEDSLVRLKNNKMLAYLDMLMKSFSLNMDDGGDIINLSNLLDKQQQLLEQCSLDLSTTTITTTSNNDTYISLELVLSSIYFTWEHILTNPNDPLVDTAITQLFSQYTNFTISIVLAIDNQQQQQQNNDSHHKIIKSLQKTMLGMVNFLIVIEAQQQERLLSPKNNNHHLNMLTVDSLSNIILLLRPLWKLDLSLLDSVCKKIGYLLSKLLPSLLKSNRSSSSTQLLLSTCSNLTNMLFLSLDYMKITSCENTTPSEMTKNMLSWIIRVMKALVSSQKMITEETADSSTHTLFKIMYIIINNYQYQHKASLSTTSPSFSSSTLTFPAYELLLHINYQLYDCADLILQATASGAKIYAAISKLCDDLPIPRNVNNSNHNIDIVIIAVLENIIAQSRNNAAIKRGDQTPTNNKLIKEEKWLSLHQLSLFQYHGQHTQQAEYISRCCVNVAAQDDDKNEHLLTINLSYLTSLLMTLIYTSWNNYPTVNDNYAKIKTKISNILSTVPILCPIIDFIKTMDDCYHPDLDISDSMNKDRLVTSCETILSDILTATSFPTYIGIDYYLLRAWICLLLTRCLWLCFDDLSLAVIYSKKAYSYVYNASLDDCVELTILKLEVNLLCADVNENYGRPSRGIEYIHQAMSMISSSSASHITAAADNKNTEQQQLPPIVIYLTYLHAIRIWLRTGSSRIRTALDTHLPLLMSSCKLLVDDDADEWSTYLTNDAAILLQQCQLTNEQLELKFIQAVMNINNNNNKSNNNLKHNTYHDLRYVKRSWENCYMNAEDLTKISIADHENKSLITLLDSTIHANVFYARNMRRYLTYCMLPNNKNDNNVKNKNNQPAIKEEEDVFTLSRSTAAANTENTIARMKNCDFHTFLLASSSCFLSLERTASAVSSSVAPVGTTFADNYAVMDVLNKSLRKDETALAKLKAGLQSLLQQLTNNNTLNRNNISNTNSSSSSSRLCFMCICKVSNSLLVGELTSSPSHDQQQFTRVISLPIADELYTILDKWQKVMEKNHHSLHDSKDAILQKTITDRQKHDWWKQRHRIDEEMKAILQEMDDLIAPIHDLLVVKKSQSNANASADDLGDSSPLFKMSGKQLTKEQGDECDTNERGWNDDNDDELDRLVFHFIDDMKIDDANDDADRTSPDNINLPPPAAAAAAAIPAVVDYENMTVAKLKDILKERKLAITGKKAELVFRLQQHDKEMKSKGAISSKTAVVSSSSSSTSVIGVKKKSTAKMTLSNPVNMNALKEKASLKQTSVENKPNQAPLTQMHAKIDKATAGDDSKSGRLNKSHLLLILDESLQAFPFESMPSLSQQSITRISGITSLLPLLNISSDSSISDKQHNGSSETKKNSIPMMIQPIQPQRCWYAVDPDNNLPETRKTMVPFLQKYEQTFNSNNHTHTSISSKWHGYVGKVPSEEQIKKHHQEANLFIYSGHGAGEKFHHHPHDVDAASSAAGAVSFPCYPSACLLWGCSSGRLVHRGNDTVGSAAGGYNHPRHQLQHDPAGPILSLLQGGAKLVIGNLWDVTDRDLDLLSMDCMKSMLSSKTAGKSIVVENYATASPVVSLCLEQARNVCKLRYAVGAAAVTYGLPLSVQM